jgi:hypothetical protein
MVVTVGKKQGAPEKKRQRGGHGPRERTNLVLRGMRILMPAPRRIEITCRSD